MMTTRIQDTCFITTYQQRIENCLPSYLPNATLSPQQLHQAMRYAVLNGGKRIRPLLVYATGKCFSAPDIALDIPAAAVEFMHCYSLVHDDLPAMDDDDIRRGKLSCHKAFDEATAILVGDALQSLAFELLAKTQSATMVATLAQACGSFGMVGGQHLDLHAQKIAVSSVELEHIQQLKTGKLITASVLLGGLAARCSTEQCNILDQFSTALGIAFQIQDDLLDQEAHTEVTVAEKRLQVLYQTACSALGQLTGDASYLMELARYIMHRKK